ncbi:hypothetical protein [Sphingomonas bacterium]|uniref:hypothetical protein n=1 Tax=Sphingomonas bacterium TaxID=1895847 RepID=UPI0026306178|nr:hypothetical protein [Sphingomonas bacterium]MDB5677684.1 hypothetical protein [Sphingomonas bacterium]
MPKPTRIYSIDSIQFALTKSIPPSLLVMASGRAVSTGWSDIKLEPLEKTLSPDGILDLAFVGVPPSDISLPMLTPVSAHFVWKDAEGVIGVKIHARSNDLTRLIFEDRGGFTTERVGEEGPPITQIAGEGQGPAEHLAKTLAIGEEHMTTFVYGEEGHPPTTLAYGEEGHPPTTLVYGEEGHPTTLALGEETVPKTFHIGEENPTHPNPIAENMTFTHGEHPASLPIIENPPTTISAETGPGDPWGPVETGGINAFGRR